MTISPIHGAQDASLTPFTHTPFILSLSLPDAARRSACTRFVQTCPISELVLMFCFTLWQFINADSSRGSLHRSRLRLLRSKQPDVIHDLPSGWIPVGCYTCVILKPFKRNKVSDFTQTRDNVAVRTLSSVGYTDTNNMTVENCVNFCNTLNFIYAGVENSHECCKCHWRPDYPSVTLVHSPCFLKTAVPPSPMKLLRHPRLNAPRFALEISPSFVVAQTVSTCITGQLPPFLRMEAMNKTDFRFIPPQAP